MFLTRLLLLILFLVALRFVVRLVRSLLTPSPSRPEVHSRGRRDDNPVRGEHVIDVEYTEEEQD